MAVNPEDLSSVRVLVTGGTSGLGRAMARSLARSGANVVVTGRDRRRARQAAAEIGVRGIELDVRDESSVNEGLDAVYEQLGGVDVLVSNAGIGMRTVNPRFMTEPQPFWDVSPDGFRDVIETKITGGFLIARAVVPRMLDAGGGRIVVISMNEQTMTRRGFVPYGPAGAGVEALARVMVADLAGTPVAVNILLPGGATATGMIPDEISAGVRQSLLDPEIMGPPIVWLCSGQAAGVHGERIVATDFSA
jgi:gluconate 5-dehydrogenase